MFWSEKPKYITRLHPKDVQAIEEFSGALRERLLGLDARIDALEAELAALKKEPRQSFKAKLKGRNT